MSDRDEEFEALLDQSSLGSSGSRKLRARTPREQVSAVRRIAELRTLRAQGTPAQQRQAESDLIDLFLDLSYTTQLAAFDSPPRDGSDAERSRLSPATSALSRRSSPKLMPGDSAGNSRIPIAVKVLIAGGSGAGKTTMVGSLSDIRPLQTEEVLTGTEDVDDLTDVDGQTTTTVVMDFGRVMITEDLQLYLFGMPGQDRFWFLWDELSQGALGAVVLADTRRLADCFPSIDYFEQRGTPFVVAVNCFETEPRFGPDAVARALDLEPGVPVFLFDARERRSARNVLVELVEYVTHRQYATAASR